jgi:hypothetical protein
MSLPNIWQVLGTSQVAGIAALVSTTVSIILAQQGQRKQKKSQ